MTEKKSEIYGAWAYRVQNPRKNYDVFPPDNALLIDVISGSYRDITDLPKEWIESVRGKANIIAIGQGDNFKIYILGRGERK